MIPLHATQLIVERLLEGLTAAGSGYHFASLAAGRRFARSRPPNTAERPPVSVLKPLHGVDPGDYENFASFCRQSYPEYELLFGVQTADDPAVELVKRLQSEFPTVRIQLVVSDFEIGANRKVCNLYNLAAHASHELLLISDSDMRVRPAYLEEIARYFSDPSVGLVTSPYCGVGVRSLSTALEAMGMATEFFPGVAVATQFAAPNFGLGSTLAIRRATLAEIGGLRALSDYLADDFQMGNRVAHAGHRVVLSRYVVETKLPDAGLRAMLARRLRWMRTARACQPAGFAGSVVTHSTVWALLLALVSGLQPWALCILGVQQLLRLSSALYLDRSVLRDRELGRWFWLLPLSDLVNFALWVGSWCGNTVVWREHHYRIVRGGRMVRIDEGHRQNRDAGAQLAPLHARKTP